MRRLLLLLLPVLALASAPAYANPNVGLQLGLNIANQNTDPPQSTDPRYGLMVGGNFEFQLDDVFFLQPEIMYVQKGASQSNSTTDVTIKYDYLEFPILAKAKFGADQVRPYLFAGPNIGFRLNSEVDTKVGNLPTQTVTTDAESIDFALDFGGGVEYWFQKETAVFFNVRYSYGLTNVVNQVNQTRHNTGVQLVTGVEFSF